MVAGPWMPLEVRDRILHFLPPLEYLRVAEATCRRYSFSSYLSATFPKVVVVPDDVSSLNVAINALSSVEGDGRGLVLVRPGKYAESVRVTHTCHILGLGPREEVIVEAPGWESALVFAGLGGRQVPTQLGFDAFRSGEDARIENVTLRCRNDLMVGRCVYIVMGQPELRRCDVHGGVIVSGLCTSPAIIECKVHGSRGNGLHFTDHCRAALQRSHVEGHGQNGILVDRASKPAILHNMICRNAAYGIRVYEGTSCQPTIIDGNCLDKNGEEGVLFTPKHVEVEHEDE